MTDQRLKSNWKASTTSSISLEQNELFSQLQKDTINLEKKITFRDFTEILLALLMIIPFGITAVLVPFMISKIGALVVILSFILIIFRFKNLKNKFVPISLSETHSVYLKKTKYYLTEQIKFLDSVVYWYILPPISGILLFFAGFGVNTFQFYKLSTITILMGIGIFLLNKYAIKKELQPRLEYINTLIDSIKEENK
jgi:hypothetical protein